MENLEEFQAGIPEIERILGHNFKDRDLLALAFIHRSFVNENREEAPGHNERLEFLGDSVLGVVVSEFLYIQFPDRPEGELSHLKSRLVEATSCSAYVEALGLDRFILLGKGERINGGRGRSSINADLFEALVGAIFLDAGLRAVKTFFFQHFSEEVDKIVTAPLRNWKAELQDYSQKEHRQAPQYEILREEGPDHSKIFEVAVLVNGERMGVGQGPSKKGAQQEAAKEALEALVGE